MRITRHFFCVVVALLSVAVSESYAYDEYDLIRLVEINYCERCNLSDAKLIGADLSGINLFRTNLRRATLFSADLSGANLSGADLSEATLFGADLSGADLSSANLSGASLFNTDLSGADLTFADLSNADLKNADLSGADLSGADLSGASLFDTNLTGAVMLGVILSGANYEPATRPNGDTLPSLEGLDSIEWVDNPNGLVWLRQTFKDAGMREQERVLTYVFRKGLNKKTNNLNAAFNYVLFDLTSGYGLYPSRLLWILLVSYLLCAFTYSFGMLFPVGGKHALWRFWPPPEERLLERDQQRPPEMVRFGIIRAPLWGLYFSLLSTFHIGWRDLNVGHWIQRASPYDYSVRATGWVKVVSGMQSLLSVYLIAMWFLTYFGRPFE
jgi:uncharacterized protein YjbI with pentapeptide repeats